MEETVRGRWIFKTVGSFIGAVLDLEDSPKFWIPAGDSVSVLVQVSATALLSLKD